PNTSRHGSRKLQGVSREQLHFQPNTSRHGSRKLQGVSLEQLHFQPNTLLIDDAVGRKRATTGSRLPLIQSYSLLPERP
ncbi:MAG TPA: hypothetical protein VGV87_27920, partial [Blastocatellia bacterium]|nr:hypothetical protein [Blastocatellia bacterium]